MIDSHAAFSRSYAVARQRFLAAARTLGLEAESYEHPMLGHDQETLAMDVVRDGSSGAGRLLVVSSGVHGVEGFCGSGVQLSALHDEELRVRARERGVAVLFVHAVNPYGFSHIRRVTHENVDLNRNFRDFSRPSPDNAGYRALHPLLLPRRWPPTPGNTARFLWRMLTGNRRALQAAVSSGQYEFPRGLFFGGTEPTWSNRTLRTVVRKYAASARHIAWIDLHTGLGPSGKGERILSARNDPQGLLDARKMWGEGVTSLFDGSSVSAPLTGMMLEAMRDECAHAHFDAIGIEYGTRPIREVFEALRAEQWLENNPDAPVRQARRIKRQMLEAFFSDTDVWKAQIVTQAREALLQAVAGVDAS